jgi:hypothetical protein
MALLFAIFLVKTRQTARQNLEGGEKKSMAAIFESYLLHSGLLSKKFNKFTFPLALHKKVPITTSTNPCSLHFAKKFEFLLVISFHVICLFSARLSF